MNAWEGMDSSSPSRSMNSGCSSVVMRGRKAAGGSKFPDAEGKINEEVVRRTTKGSGSGSIIAWEGEAGGSERKPTKLLLNVNVQNGLGPVHVVMSPENTVKDLIKAVMELYVKEKRRPLLPSTEPHFFQLHYSPFILEGIKAEEKLENLGSRNFFLCPKPSKSSYFDQAKTVAKFMDYFL